MSASRRKKRTRELETSTRLRHIPRRVLVLAVMISLILTSGCADAPTSPAHLETSATGATRVTDLLNKGDDDAPTVFVEEFDGDFRPAWVSSLVGPFGARLDLAADGCELVLGLRATGSGPSAGIHVVARVDRLVDGVEMRVLEEELVTDEKSRSPWRDLASPIPGDKSDGARPARLVFSAKRLDEGSIDGLTVGWSMPHTVCHSLPLQHRAPPRSPHVVFVSIDTLRADHLSLYGYRRQTSPFLDAFAKRAVVFEQAFSTAPWTAPSHASMFTGLYPEQHGAGHDDPLAPLPSSVDTMATILRRHGYRTLGFVAGGVMAPESGLGQGFDRYDSHPRARLRSFFPAVLEEVERSGDTPIFLFLHTYDVHGPYIQPRGMRAFEADDLDPLTDDDEWARIRTPGLHDYLRLDRFKGLPDVVAAYDSGIHYVDRELEIIFGQLRAMGILDEALVIITSDHGESLYDRNLYIGHTYTLYDELLHVPLIVRRVGATKGMRKIELTDSTDLLPMVLEELGIELPPGLAGRNPLRALRPGEVERSFVRGEAAHTGATFIRSDRHKVVTDILPFDDPRSHLPALLRERIVQGTQWFDLVLDPGERQNRAAPARGSVRSMSAVLPLADVLEKETRNEAEHSEPAPRDLSEEQKEELRSLGYAD